MIYFIETLSLSLSEYQPILRSYKSLEAQVEMKTFKLKTSFVEECC